MKNLSNIIVGLLNFLKFFSRLKIDCIIEIETETERLMIKQMVKSPEYLKRKRKHKQCSWRQEQEHALRYDDNTEMKDSHAMPAYQNSIRVWVLIHRCFEAVGEIFFPVEVV